jgi:hypothetical protein
MPRNLTPAIVIAGMPDAPVSDVVLENIVIKFAGGGNALFAHIPLDQLDKVPEKANAYPDFSMFGELPAWGAWIRHAKKIECRHLDLTCGKKDYRVAVVLDDVHDARFIATGVKQPGRQEGQAGLQKNFYMYRSSGITTK